MPAPTLDLGDFHLRPFRPGDAAEMTEQFDHWEIIKMLTTPPYPYSLSDAEAFIDSAQNRPFCWAIAKGDQLMGCVEISNHLGYWLGKPFWGGGIMTRAAGAAVDTYFAADTADTIISGCLFDNPASHRVLTKVGFRETGHSYVLSNARGGQVEHIDMELTRAAWAEQRHAP